MPTKDTTSPKKAATPAPAAAPAAPAAPSAPAAQPAPQATGPIINQAAAVELLTQKLPIPYPAALVVLVGLAIVNASSLIGIINIGLEKLFASGSSTSSLFANAMAGSVQAVSAMLQASMLIVGIPALIFLVKVVNKYEDSEPWRTRQKLRRATYAIGATLLVITLLGTMVQMVFSLLVAGAGSNVGATVLRVLISSIISLTVVGGALYALVNFSRGQNASTVRTIFIAAVAIAVVMVPFALYQVYTKGVSDSSSSRSRSSSESLRDYSTGGYRSRSGSGSSWSDM